jgi:hypothetical protein
LSITTDRRHSRSRIVFDLPSSSPARSFAVDSALADELVTELCEERSAIERAAVEGRPLKRTVRIAGGGSYEMRRRSVRTDPCAGPSTPQSESYAMPSVGAFCSGRCRR